MSKRITDVQAPGMSPEEQAINQKILDLLNKQENDANLFKPILLGEAGLSEVHKKNPYGFKDTTDLADQIYNQKKNFGTDHATLKGLVDESNNNYTRMVNAQKEIDKLNRSRDPNRPWNNTSIDEKIQKQKDIQNQVATRNAEINSTVQGYQQDVTSYEKTAERIAQEEAYNKIAKATGEIALLQAERQKKALDGTLPVSKGLIERKAKEFELLKENAARKGHTITGDTPETATADSTAGNELLGQFNTRYGLMEDAERRGEIDSGTANFLNTSGASEGESKYGTPNFGYGGLIQAYGNAAQPYQFNRSMVFNARSQTQQNRSGLLSGLLNAGATGATAYAFA